MNSRQKKLLGTVLALILALVGYITGFKGQDTNPSQGAGSAATVSMSVEEPSAVSASAGISTESEEDVNTTSASGTDTESAENISAESTSAAGEADTESETEIETKIESETEDPADPVTASSADSLNGYTEDLLTVEEDGQYISKEEVALYLHIYGHLPSNFITKNEAKDLGWVSSKGNLQKVAPGMSIGGDRFGNREELLPTKKGRKYYECDINYTGGHRGADRIIFSDDGLIYFTADHYETFELLYGEE